MPKIGNMRPNGISRSLNTGTVSDVARGPRVSNTKQIAAASPISACVMIFARADRPLWLSRDSFR